MNRFTSIALMAMTCGTFAWLGLGAPAQAATVIDTFELKGTFKEFCEGNPKFIETIKWGVTDGVTLIVTRDVNGDGDFTDIAATINNPDAHIDAIILKGLAFPSNKAHSKEELVLSGVNPGSDDHYLTIRGQATFDTLSNLTKVTGKAVYQVRGTYTIDKKTHAQSDIVECFASGTFGTGKKIVVP